MTFSFRPILTIVFGISLLYSSLFAQSTNFLTYSEVSTIFKLSATTIQTKYPTLALVGDVPYFHKNYLVDIFYQLPSSTIGEQYHDSSTTCIMGLGLMRFTPKAKLKEKALLYQFTNKERILAIEEELNEAQYEMVEVEDAKNFYIKKYVKGKSHADVILFNIKKRLEIGACYRVYFYNE